MKVGDLVTSKVSIHRVPVEITIGIPYPGYPKHELGIITEIGSKKLMQYAKIWWFCYDETEKGEPPEEMPIKHLAIISTL